MNIDAYSAILTDAQLSGGGKSSPALFENCPDFGQKDPDCVHIWVNFSI